MTNHKGFLIELFPNQNFVGSDLDHIELKSMKEHYKQKTHFIQIREHQLDESKYILVWNEFDQTFYILESEPIKELQCPCKRITLYEDFIKKNSKQNWVNCSSMLHDLVYHYDLHPRFINSAFF